MNGDEAKFILSPAFAGRQVVEGCHRHSYMTAKLKILTFIVRGHDGDIPPVAGSSLMDDVWVMGLKI